MLSALEVCGLLPGALAKTHHSLIGVERGPGAWWGGGTGPSHAPGREPRVRRGHPCWDAVPHAPPAGVGRDQLAAEAPGR